MSLTKEGESGAMGSRLALFIAGGWRERVQGLVGAVIVLSCNNAATWVSSHIYIYIYSTEYLPLPTSFPFISTLFKLVV